MAEGINQGTNCSTATTPHHKNSKSTATTLECINTLFFDLDNTLIPTRTGDFKAVKKLAEVLENQFGFNKDEAAAVTQAFLKAFRRCPDSSQTSLDSWRTYLWREALPARYKHLAEQIYPIWLQLRYRCLALQPDFVHLLRRFHDAGFLLALITNGPSNAQWEKIKKLNVSQYFDCILVSSDLPWEKPNPNIFHAACNVLGVKPIECAMIGDKLESDIKGGRLANLGATFWIPLNSGESSASLSDIAHPPDILLQHLLDIFKYFPTLSATGGGLSSTTGTANSLAMQFRRRSSQVCCTTTANAVAPLTAPTSTSMTTTTTCDSNSNLNLYHTITNYQYRRHQLQSTAYSTHNPNCEHPNKYRRGGSLPAIECFGSEAENSSDSIFS